MKRKRWRIGGVRVAGCVLRGGAAALLLFETGCANVKPWDRDALADYAMRPDRDPVAASTREHLWFSREAANGGRSVGGGGCGCN